MKVLLINKFFYPRGGSEKVFFDTAQLLAQAGNEVVFFSMKDRKNQPSEEAEFFIDNLDFRKREGFFVDLKKAGHYIYSTEAKKKLEELLDKEKPDIAHLHNISHQITPSIISVLKKHKIPVVQTLHDYQLICPNYHLFTHGQACERCKKVRYYNAFFYKCLQNSYSASFLGMLELTVQRIFKFYKEQVDLFITPSAFLKDKLRAWDIKEEIEVVNNPFDATAVAPNYAVGNFLYCVARFIPGKGIKTLIDAVKELSEVKLKIAGDGPQLQELVDYLEKIKATNIELVGCQTTEQILATMKQCRFFVMPSELPENYPTVILEAFACGKPTLSSRIGGAPELVKDNQTGWLFTAGNINELRDKIKNIWNQTEVIEELGKQARAFVEKNNEPRVYLEKILNIYNRLLNRKTGMG